MDVRLKKLDENAVIPKYAKPGDAGVDLTAVSARYDEKINCWIYGIGLAFEIPKGYVGLIFPRSSSREKDPRMANCVAVIDSGYRGEVEISFKDRPQLDFEQPYNVGDRVAQMIIIPYPEINFILSDTLSESERGTGGHGSTGK